MPMPLAKVSILMVFCVSKSLTSSNPDDPQVVADTILEQFWFDLLNVSEKTVIDGFTITSQWDGLVTADPQEGDGGDGTTMVGGAMVLRNSSPRIRNCNFLDCSITGGDGANGVGNGPPYGYDGGWAGRAYGGAVYMIDESNPLFINCTFDGCFARGGNGGNGCIPRER